jgi:excisionase family DNA binding protein
MKLPETISVSAAAKRLRTSNGTIYRLIAEGKLRASRTTIKGWWQVERSSLEGFMSKLRKDYHLEGNR